MENHRSLRHLLTVLAALLVLMLLASAVGHAVYSLLYSKTYEANYRDKLHRLSTLEGEKAVFIGGSSCMFGIQSALFEEQTGIPSVNMAISYGIPIRLYLDSADPHLKAGDKLFFALEYGGYSSDWDGFGNAAVNFLLYSDPSVLKKLSLSQVLQLVPDLLSYGWANWENSVQELIRYYLLGGFGVYGRNSLNENGDMIATKGLPNEPGITGGSMNYKDNGTAEIIHRRLAELADRGVEVYIVYEPLMEGRLTPGIPWLHGQILGWDEVTVLFAPDELRYPQTSYFNSDQHLDYETAQEHTQRIIDRYKEVTSTP